MNQQSANSLRVADALRLAVAAFCIVTLFGGGTVAVMSVLRTSATAKSKPKPTRDSSDQTAARSDERNQESAPDPPAIVEPPTIQRRSHPDLPIVVSLDEPKSKAPLRINYDPASGLLLAIHGGRISESSSSSYRNFTYAVEVSDDGKVSISPSEPFPDVTGEITGSAMFWPDGPDADAVVAVCIGSQPKKHAGEILFFNAASREFLAACTAPYRAQIVAVGGVQPSILALGNTPNGRGALHVASPSDSESKMRTLADILLDSGLKLPVAQVAADLEPQLEPYDTAIREMEETVGTDHPSIKRLKEQIAAMREGKAGRRLGPNYEGPYVSDVASEVIASFVWATEPPSRDRNILSVASNFNLSDGETPLLRAGRSVYDLAASKVRGVFDFMPIARVPGTDVVMGVRNGAIASGSLSTGQTLVVRSLPGDALVAKSLVGSVNHTRVGASQALNDDLGTSLVNKVSFAFDTHRDLLLCCFGRKLLVDQLSNYIEVPKDAAVRRTSKWTSPLTAHNAVALLPEVPRLNQPEPLVKNARKQAREEVVKNRPEPAPVRIARRLKTEFDNRIIGVVTEPGNTAIVYGADKVGKDYENSFVARISLPDGETLTQSAVSMKIGQTALAGDHLLVMAPSRSREKDVPMGVLDRKTLQPVRLEQVPSRELQVVPGRFVLLKPIDQFSGPPLRFDLPTLRREELPTDRRSRQRRMIGDPVPPPPHAVPDGFLWDGYVWDPDVKTRRMLLEPKGIALAGKVVPPSGNSGRTVTIRLGNSYTDPTYEVLSQPARFRWIRAETTAGGTVIPGSEPRLAILRADCDETLQAYRLEGGMGAPGAASGSVSSFQLTESGGHLLCCQRGKLWGIPLTDVSRVVAKSAPAVAISTKQPDFVLPPSGVISCEVANAESVLAIGGDYADMITRKEQPAGDGSRSGTWKFQVNIDGAIQIATENWSKGVRLPRPGDRMSKLSKRDVESFNKTAKQALDKYLEQTTDTYRELVGKDPEGVPLGLPITFIATGVRGGESMLSYTYLVDVPRKRFNLPLPKKAK